ncbi:hypothetical protein ACW9HQ_37645, partial [Nocardia gipuzkoensis]
RHPDHRHAGQATTLAVTNTRIPAKLYYTAHGTAYWARVAEALAEAGTVRPQPDPDRLRITDRIDRDITTRIDVRSVLDHKRAALYAHASQLHNSTAAKIPAERWPEVFRTEDHIRVYDTTGTAVPESDLFDGIAP